VPRPAGLRLPGKGSNTRVCMRECLSSPPAWTGHTPFSAPQGRLRRAAPGAERRTPSHSRGYRSTVHLAKIIRPLPGAGPAS